MKRQKLLLTGLLIIFAFSVAYAWFRTPRQRVAPPARTDSAAAVPSRAAATSVSPAAATPTTYQPLMLPEPEQAEVIVKRNLFKPLQGIETTSAHTRNAAVKPVPPPPPPPPPPPTPQELARKELTHYKALGLLKKQGTTIAFLSKAGQIRLIRVGDSLFSGYKATNITDDRLILRSDTGDELSLRLR
jgi:Tfp pilus assembly protein PilP